MYTFVTRERLLDIINAIVTYDGGATPTTRDIVRFITHRDVVAGRVNGTAVNVAEFAFGDIDTEFVSDMYICERALTSRECPEGHRWMPPSFPEGMVERDLPFLPFTTWVHPPKSPARDEREDRVFAEVSAAFGV